MERHYFNPTPGAIYENKGGGCQMYDDGTIEWDGSTGGYFAEN